MVWPALVTVPHGPCKNHTLATTQFPSNSGRLANLLKGKVKCRNNSQDDYYEDQNANLVGRHQQTIAVEPVVARKTLPLSGGHYCSVLHHKVGPSCCQLAPHQPFISLSSVQSRVSLRHHASSASFLEFIRDLFVGASSGPGLRPGRQTKLEISPYQGGLRTSSVVTS